MARHGVPTARFRTCDSLDEALASVRGGEFGFPVVLKADGLAAGKGVVIARRSARRPRRRCARRCASAGSATAGDRLVIEECLDGSGSVVLRRSATAARAVPIGTAQDHKRIFDDDRGPNTGGMGAFAPSPLVDAALASARHARDRRAGDRRDGRRRASVPRVSLRRPDADRGRPEGDRVQRAPRRSRSAGRAAADRRAAAAAARGRRDRRGCDRRRCALGAERLVGVVLASRGYPESSESGRPIAGVDARRSHSGRRRCITRARRSATASS